MSVFPSVVDKAAVCSFFFGAVVPLVVLGAIIENSALTMIGASVRTADPLQTALVLSAVACLSLLSFFNLRRLFVGAIGENQKLAFFDSLTGLPNRRLWMERLEEVTCRARAQGDLVAICFLDLDGFKRVNDTLGHEAGDDLLCQVSKRLTSEIRAGDAVVRRGQQVLQHAVSRFGGDEFTIILTDITDARDASRVADRILKVLSEPFMLGRRRVFVTASIGITVFPQDGEDTATLLKNADSAMYLAKQCGRNNHQFYAKSLDELATRRFAIEEMLRQAIENDELSIVYQALCDASTGQVTGAEALLRCRDPLLGEVSPAEFIPVAEDSGLILKIGEWILRKACAQAVAWDREGSRPIRIAVNISGIQVQQAGLVDLVREILEETGLAPTRLELEITESTIMGDDTATTAVFEALKDMGVSLVLDDFGTGYSSLSYLRRIPLQKVKIDRSFVTRIPDNVDDSVLVAAIISMAHSLRLSVVAEGVENALQADYLRELGCDELQGFYFAKPVPPGDFDFGDSSASTATALQVTGL